MALPTGARGRQERDVRGWRKAKPWGPQPLRPPESQSCALRQPVKPVSSWPPILTKQHGRTISLRIWGPAAGRARHASCPRCGLSKDDVDTVSRFQRWLPTYRRVPRFASSPFPLSALSCLNCWIYSLMGISTRFSKSRTLSRYLQGRRLWTWVLAVAQRQLPGS